jgi:integrase
VLGKDGLWAQTNRLSARAVASITQPGRHADGGNLYLNVTAAGGRSWVFMYRFGSRQREMGFGSTHDLPLARARELAAKCRRNLAARKDPMSVRQAPKIATFGQCADQFIDTMQSAWRNEKHRAQWCMTLSTYAKSLRSIAVDQITTEDVLRVLKPLWITKPETASRLRGRIEAVLDAAKAQGLRLGENPARWRGHLENLLPRRPKLSRGHHQALPLKDLPDFMLKLRSARSVSARALEFAILTAARTGEVLGARWSEMDVDAGVWTIPAERMKAGREHRVPVSVAAKAILKQMRESTQGGEFVFPGAKQGRQLPAMALHIAMRRLEAGATPHGFRSTFGDWAAEATSFPHEVCEMALAHTIANKVEASYRRGDLFEKRRLLMEAWASACGTRTDNVVPMTREAGAR